MRNCETFANSPRIAAGPTLRNSLTKDFPAARTPGPHGTNSGTAIQKGRTKTLVVHALDRLGRSLPHLVKIITTCVEKNVTLVSFRENLDLSTAQGRLIAGIFSVLAEYELSMIRDRTRSGMRAAKARGSQIGPKKHHFDKEKATRLREQGWGQIKIAKELGVGIGRVNQWVKEEYIPAEVSETDK